jgi:Ca2+-binding EF-hand superfamily protein
MSRRLSRSLMLLCEGAILMLGLGAATVPAQDPTPPPGIPPSIGGGQGMRFQMPTFADLDKNKDKKISRDEFQGPPQFFDRLDENKDGFIDEEEWNRMRARMGGGGGGGSRLAESLMKFFDSNSDTKVTREEFARVTLLFDALDKDHDGQLTQEELGRFFQAMSEVQAQATGGVDVDRLFQNMDKNKDGRIGPDEMPNEKMFKAMDLNKDGVITREEAAQALKQLAEQAKQKKPATQPQ